MYLRMLPPLLLMLSHSLPPFLLLPLLPQVVSIADAKDGRLSVTYASLAPPPAAAADGSAAAAPEQQQQQLVVDALVLATGGFGASKEMLRVCVLYYYCYNIYYSCSNSTHIQGLLYWKFTFLQQQCQQRLVRLLVKKQQALNNICCGCCVVCSLPT
jgi:hypothetical protein